MADFSGAPVSDAYYQRVDANNQQSARNLQSLGQMMTLQRAQQEMAQAPEDRLLKRRLIESQIGENDLKVAKNRISQAREAEKQALIAEWSALPDADPRKPVLQQKLRVLIDPSNALDPAKTSNLPWYVQRGPDGKTTIDPAYKEFEALKASKGGTKITMPDSSGKPQFKDGQWVYPPSAEYPQGRVVKPPEFETKDERKVRFNSEVDKLGAIKALQSAGYDPTTGKDTISELIKTATGGIVGRGVDEALGAMNVALPGKKANATLKAASSKIVMDMMGGKLGSGISNADRDFISEQLGAVGNPNLTTQERLSAWNFAKQRMIDIGIPVSGTKAIGVPGVRNNGLSPQEQDELNQLRKRFKK